MINESYRYHLKDRLNNHDFIRNLILGNNIIWYLMFYDAIIIKNNYHLTLLKDTDILFFNATQAAHSMTAQEIDMIELFYQQKNIIPAFFLDPTCSLKDYLEQHQYTEIPAEIENWWGCLLTEEILHTDFQHYLKISMHHIETKIINPNNLKDLNDFLSILQVTHQLPSDFIDKIRINMRKNIYPAARNILILIYVNGTPAASSAVGLYQNMAFLACAGTLSKFRNLGLHTYITLYCLKYAYQHGAAVAALTCTDDSITQFTAKKVGMELLFQRIFMLKNYCNQASAPLPAALPVAKQAVSK